MKMEINMISELKAKTLELRKARSSLGSIMQFHVAEVSKIGKNKSRETTEDEAIQYIKKTVQRLKEDELCCLKWRQKMKFVNSFPR